MHAEAVLLVDDGKRQLLEGDVLLEERVGAEQEIDLARGEALEGVRCALCPRSRPVRMAMRMPAASASGAMVL